jgi:hypothetical protein
MSKLSIKALDINNAILFEKEFDGNNFYESTFVQVSLKLKIIEPPIDYYKNNLAGLKLRKSYRLTNEEKNLLVNNDKIDKELKYILSICLKNSHFEKDPIKLISYFSGLNYSILPDINDFFETNKKYYSFINLLSFEKID